MPALASVADVDGAVVAVVARRVAAGSAVADDTRPADAGFVDATIGAAGLAAITG
jgi:hypothetical protein